MNGVPLAGAADDAVRFVIHLVVRAIPWQAYLGLALGVLAVVVLVKPRTRRASD